jgi:multiple sugar transport system permease protein
VKSERRALALMAGPYLVGLTLLVAGPALYTFALALTEYDLVRAPRFVGLGNFRELWEDGLFHAAVRNSGMFALFAVPIRLAGALVLGLLLATRLRGGRTYRTAVYLPTVVPDAAYALLWLWILNPLYGPLNLTLEALGAPTPRWMTDPLHAQWGVILMAAFQLGEGFLVVLAVRQAVPRELYDAAAVDGAGPLALLRRITLPLLAPALILLFLRDTIWTLQSSFVPALLVWHGGPPFNATTYVPLFVYRNGFEYLRYGYASAATVVLVVLTALVILVQWRLLRRWRALAV